MITGHNRVIEIDVNSNKFIKKNVPLKRGKYLLQYDWAARYRIYLWSCKMVVYLSNQFVQSNTPVDYHMHHIQHGKYIFTVDRFSIDGTELTFCGE